MHIVKRIQLKLKRESLYLYRDLKHGLGLSEQFYKSALGSRIMVHHGICLADHTKFNSIFLTLRTFESHLKFYKKYFNVVSLDDYYQQKFSKDKFNICLTFDDGFANNYKYVLPLLAQYQLPATFFITAISHAGYDVLWNDFLSIVSKYGPKQISYKNHSYKKDKHNRYILTETSNSLNETLRNCGFTEKAEMMEELYPLVPFKADKKDEDYWLQMSREQIRQVAASPYVTIGAHGYYHNDLAKISIEDVKEELVNTKTYLETIIGKPVNSFAFPYGSYNADVVDAAKKAGYDKLLAVDFLSIGDTRNNALRERFTVNPFISIPNQMYATITRKYEQH